MPKTKEQLIEQEAKATLRRVEEKDKGLKQLLSQAYGYAVFPTVGKASLVVGGSYGKGAVFERGKFIGYATIGQTTVGVQIGGDTFTEIVVFENKQTLDRLKKGQMAFAADASAVLVKAGAAAARGFGNGTRAFVYGEGGMLLEAAIGGQKFNFKPRGEQKGGTAEQKKEQPNRQQDEDERESEEQDSEGEGSVLGQAKDVMSRAVDFAKKHPWATGIAGATAAGGIAWMLARRLWSDQQSDSDTAEDQEGEQDQGNEPDEQMSGEQGDQEEGEQEDQDQDQDEEQEDDQNMSNARGRNSSGGRSGRSGAFARG